MSPVAQQPKKAIVAEENLGLVHSCANRFRNRGIEYDDLFQAGCVGLVKAITAFDTERGVMFSTYAVPVILGEIRRLFRDGGTIKVSRSIKELGLKALRCREALSAHLGYEPTVSQIAEKMEQTPEAIAQAISATSPPISLTQNEDDGGGQLDLPTESHEEKMSDLLSLEYLLTTLEPKDRSLIYYRYFKEMTQTQTAQLLDMTQVQVSRREKKILTGLKSRMIGGE